MEFLKIFGCFLAIIGMGLFLGRLDHHKHPELFTYGWLGVIIVLALMRFFI